MHSLQTQGLLLQEKVSLGHWVISQLIATLSPLSQYSKQKAVACYFQQSAWFILRVRSHLALQQNSLHSRNFAHINHQSLGSYCKHQVLQKPPQVFLEGFFFGGGEEGGKLKGRGHHPRMIQKNLLAVWTRSYYTLRQHCWPYWRERHSVFRDYVHKFPLTKQLREERDLEHRSYSWRIFTVADGDSGHLQVFQMTRLL